MSELLRSAENIDSYRHRCAINEYNAKARAADDYSPFFVDKTVAAFIESVAEETPLLRRSKIVILKPSADCGFPHTRPDNIICMPSASCAATNECRITLIHEGIHLHQRQFMREWVGYCIDQGWKQHWADSIPAKYIQRVRINPDTMMCPYWSWQEHYVPLPLFVDKPNLKLSDAEVKWLDLRMGSLTVAPPSFSARYGTPSQPEHPFELAAVEMAPKCRTDEDIFNIIR